VQASVSLSTTPIPLREPVTVFIPENQRISAYELCLKYDFNSKHL
jgi:hypothetical protein